MRQLRANFTKTQLLHLKQSTETDIWLAHTTRQKRGANLNVSPALQSCCFQCAKVLKGCNWPYSYGEERKGHKRLIYKGKIRDICVPHLLENSLMMFDTQNYERHIHMKWWPFSRLNGLYLLYFVHSFHLWTKYNL